MDIEQLARYYENKGIDSNRRALNCRVMLKFNEERKLKKKAAHCWQVWTCLKELKEFKEIIDKEPIAIIDDKGNAYHVVDVEALSEVVRMYEG